MIQKYQHTIDLTNNTEYIEHHFDYKEHHLIQNKLFYTVCDLLSVDYKKVTKTLYQLTSEAHETCMHYEKFDKKFEEILLSHSVLLETHSYVVPTPVFAVDDIDSNFAPTRDFFEILTRIIEYIDRMSNEAILLNKDVFALFASSYCNTSFFPYYNSSISIYKPFELLNEHEELNNSTPHGLLNNYLKQLKPNKQSNMQHKKYFNETLGLLSFACSNVYYILSNKMTIKRCTNCGKFFVAYNRSDTLYCDRTAPQDSNKTCKEYGTTKLWYDRLQNDETKKLYRNIYQQKQMLVRRNPDIEDYKTDFDNFKNAAKTWKEKVKDGAATESDYLQWLKGVKEKKVTY